MRRTQLSVPVLRGPARGHRFAGEGVRASVAIMAGRYEPAMTAFLRATLPDARTFYDVGAHTGYFSRMALALMPPHGRVVAFEPDPSRHEVLRALDPSRLTIRDEAVGAADRAGTLVYSAGACPRLSDAIPHDTGESLLQPMQVRSLDSLLAQGELPAPDAMKVDVEGSELAVLAGAGGAMRALRAIAVECHSMRIFSEVLRVVIDAGFGCVRSTAGGDGVGPPTVLALRAS